MTRSASSLRRRRRLRPRQRPRPPARRVGVRDVAADGVRLAYDVYGAGDPTLVLLPVGADHPLAPVEGPGPLPRSPLPRRDLRRPGQRPLGSADSTRSPTPTTGWSATSASSWTRRTRTGRCSSGCASTASGDPSGSPPTNPERVLGIVAFGVGVPRLAPPQPHYVAASATFDDVLPTTDGWAKLNRHYWQRDYADFARFFFSEIYVRAALDEGDRGRDRLGARRLGRGDARRARPLRSTSTAEEVEAICRVGRLPDAPRPRHGGPCQRPARAHRLAELTGAPLVLVEGADHMIPGRHPVLANLLIRDFVDSLDRRSAHEPVHDHLDPGARPRPPRAVHLVADRARPRAARRRRSRTSCASSIPTSRSTGSPSTRSPRSSRRAASGSTR